MAGDPHLIELPFDPDLTLGPLVLAWHAIFAVLAVFVGTTLAVRLASSRVPEDRGWQIATWAVVSGFVGARALHVFERWEYFVADPARVFAVSDGGLSILGAVIGGFAAMSAATARLRAPVGFLADVGGSVAGVGMGIGRIGDIVNGEHHAVACSGGLPWCVRYTHPNTLGQRDYVHPAVAYELVLDFAIAALLLTLRSRIVGRVPEGRLLWAFLVLYGAGRFAISFLRLDPLIVDGLRQAQVVALGLVGSGAVMLAYLRTRARRRA